MIFAKENVRTYKAYTRDLALPFALWPYFYWVAAVPIATERAQSVITERCLSDP